MCNRNAAPRFVGLAFAIAIAGAACVPGKIAPRKAASSDDGGGASGGEAGGESIVGRDAAASAGGGSGGSSSGGASHGGNPGSVGHDGNGGSAGSVVTVVDAARAVEDGPSEMPERPSTDAGRGVANDAAADLPRQDAASADATPDAPSARLPRAGELAIDEVLVNPTGDDLGREWIEAVNLGADWLDLSGLHLANASVDVAVAGGRIAPGGLRLFGQSADPGKNGGAPVDAAYGTKLILNNADGQVSVCVGACASGLVLDTVSWGTLGDAYTGHALVVDPATQAICAASTPFGTGASFGTPGAPNPPCAESGDAGPAGAAIR
jgi:hypothetical protein